MVNFVVAVVPDFEVVTTLDFVVEVVVLVVVVVVVVTVVVVVCAAAIRNSSVNSAEAPFSAVSCNVTDLDSSCSGVPEITPFFRVRPSGNVLPSARRNSTSPTISALVT